jgi:hypothetical protein
MRVPASLTATMTLPPSRRLAIRLTCSISMRKLNEITLTTDRLKASRSADDLIAEIYARACLRL